ncbi:alkaline ceramidase [Negadavirga shengliensis]|uniref:Alkaline ceramidase n=1 Tax=Negadavirga shengliensis TaxID=1389218 RepID=A0ABV9T0X8_9BACT
MVKKGFRFLAYIFAVLVILGTALITTVDWTPYQETDYYQTTMDRLQQFELEQKDVGYVLAGWGKANFTPGQPVPLVAYKPRGDYEFVEDSSFVKALVFGTPDFKVAVLNYELLIIHPHLAQRIRSKVAGSGFNIDQFYFTATHTHSGIGGTIPGLIGFLAMGGWDEEIVTLLEEKTLLALNNAVQKMDTVSIGYKKANAAGFVANRLIAEDPVDPFLRQLVFENTAGETCAFVTYSAHATCLNSRFMGLSGDYPHYLTGWMQEHMDFALFASGTVGSHRPMAPGNDIQSVKQYAYSLDTVLRGDGSDVKPVSGTMLKIGTLPLALRSPHYRISDNLRLRPWVFNWIFGDNPAHFDVVQLGNTLLISSSGELSGVFYENWENLAEQNGFNLMVTTFNGGYVGYITPDEYYHKKLYEVRDMNLYGPYNGAYFNEVMEGLIDKAIHPSN